MFDETNRKKIENCKIVILFSRFILFFTFSLPTYFSGRDFLNLFFCSDGVDRAENLFTSQAERVL